jgi:hypothetical protein
MCILSVGPIFVLLDKESSKRAPILSCDEIMDYV